MKAAVFTLTRDRLAYTKHCFAKLRELAGCEFDHFIVDNGSQDGTVDWLADAREHGHHLKYIRFVEQNRGLAFGCNEALFHIKDFGPYSAVVKFDNDCEALTSNFLARAVDFVASHPKAVCSPRVEGLGKPPPYEHPSQTVSFGERVLRMGHLGGICHIAPWDMYEQFPGWDTRLPIARGADSFLSAWLGRNGWAQFYLLDVTVNHYKTTGGQAKDFPEYFKRKKQEEVTRHGTG